MRHVAIFLGVMGIVALAAAGAQATALQYNWVDIGGYPGSTYVDTEIDLGAGTCVNDSGQITGTTYYHTTGSPPPAPVSHSFLWTPGTGMTYFPTGAGSNGFWEAMSVNDAGTVVGQGAVSGGNAVMWTSAGGITAIPRINNATGSTVEAETINNAGLIGGEDDGVGDAFVYNTNTLHVYDCGPDTSAVFGISNSGLAVGVSYGSRAFTWTASGGAVTLSTVNAVNDISSNGTYVAAQTGGSAGGWGSGNPAIYNTLNHGTTTIGSDGICWSVNSSGVAVGSATIGGVSQAFVYSGGTLYPLASLLSTSLPANTTFLEATSISDTGLIAVEGAYTVGSNYYYHTFLLTPTPEPSTLLLTATAMLGLLAYAWRRRR